MNESKRLTHDMTVSPIAFRHNLRLPTAPAQAQARGVRPDLLVFSQSHDCSLALLFWVPASPLRHELPAGNMLAVGAPAKKKVKV